MSYAAPTKTIERCGPGGTYTFHLFREKRRWRGVVCGGGARRAILGLYKTEQQCVEMCRAMAAQIDDPADHQISLAEFGNAAKNLRVVDPPKHAKARA